jgi:hypothetical protein
VDARTTTGLETGAAELGGIPPFRKKRERMGHGMFVLGREIWRTRRASELERGLLYWMPLQLFVLKG